jgi:hypothetical protein
MAQLRKRKELAEAYQQQMDIYSSQRRFERMEDQRLEQLAHEVESRREIDRQNVLLKERST